MHNTHYIYIYIYNGNSMNIILLLCIVCILSIVLDSSNNIISVRTRASMHTKY